MWQILDILVTGFRFACVEWGKRVGDYLGDHQAGGEAASYCIETIESAGILIAASTVIVATVAVVGAVSCCCQHQDVD